MLYYSFLLTADEAMNTISVLRSEKLWTPKLHADVVQQVIDAAKLIDKKFASVLSDHPLNFRYLPAIWTPIFYLIRDLDWFNLSFMPDDDVERVSLLNIIWDNFGYDFSPSDLEACLGIILPKLVDDDSLEITENGPKSINYDFSVNPVAEVSKLSLEDALKHDFIKLVTDKVGKKNIFKWLMTLLQKEAIPIISIAYAFEKLPCCESLRLPRVPENRGIQQVALRRCAECRSDWSKFDFHPTNQIKLPESMVWDVFYEGMLTLISTKMDPIPTFLNAPVQTPDGRISKLGKFEIVVGRGNHSVYKLNKYYDLVKSTGRAGITLSKMTILLRLISKLKRIGASIKIMPSIDFRQDAEEWIKMFIYGSNVRAHALLEAAGEDFSLLLRPYSETNVDSHPHIKAFQAVYFKYYEFRFCEDCDDACIVNKTLDKFFTKVAKLLKLKPDLQIALQDIVGRPAVKKFVARNFDICDDEKYWNSTDTSIFKETNGFTKVLLFGMPLDSEVVANTSDSIIEIASTEEINPE